VVVSDLLFETSELGRSFESLHLAKTVICESAAEGRSYSAYRDVEVVDFSADGSLAQLSAIYQRLSSGTEERQ
jgi:hypothetical protein